MTIDLSKSLYCIDKVTDKVRLIDGIFFPIGKDSGKDIAVLVEDDLSEWRSINDVVIIDNVGD